MRCQTQWRHAGMDGVITGLDYTAVESVMRLMRIKNRGEVFDGVQAMEYGALTEFR